MEVSIIARAWRGKAVTKRKPGSQRSGAIRSTCGTVRGLRGVLIRPRLFINVISVQFLKIGKIGILPIFGKWRKNLIDRKLEFCIMSL
jgi:hypothetical protein